MRQLAASCIVWAEKIGIPSNSLQSSRMMQQQVPRFACAPCDLLHAQGRNVALSCLQICGNRKTVCPRAETTTRWRPSAASCTVWAEDSYNPHLTLFQNWLPLSRMIQQQVPHFACEPCDLFHAPRDEMLFCYVCRFVGNTQQYPNGQIWLRTCGN